FTAKTKGTAVFSTASYTIGQTQGLFIAFVGTNANLLIKDFAVAGLLAVPIPPNAHVGDRYLVQVLYPSGNADAQGQPVPMVPMPARSAVVTEATYLVGDSSPATWYNAAQFDAPGVLRHGFGDGLLENSDANNAFDAALGNRVPFPNTDLFDALDAFPE